MNKKGAQNGKSSEPCAKRDSGFGTMWCQASRKLARIHPAVWAAATAAVLAVTLPFLPRHAWSMLLRGLAAQRFLMGFLVLFTLVGFSLAWSAGQKLDAWFFAVFNSRGTRPKWLDKLMLGFTQLGNGVFAYSLALLFLLLRRRLIAYEIIFGSLTLWLVVELMKLMFRRKRPYSFLQDARVVGHRAGGHSFPSGHTSQAFFVASLLPHYLRVPGGVGVLFYVAALLVGITRIYVGMHYPRDVLGGAVLGTAWGLVGVVINSYIFTRLSVVY